jgi:hypothetical protein
LNSTPKDTTHFGATLGGGGDLPPDKNTEGKKSFSQSMLKRIKSLKPSRANKSKEPANDEAAAQSQNHSPPQYEPAREIYDIRRSIDKILDAEGPPTSENDQRLLNLFREENGDDILTENQRALLLVYRRWPRVPENQTQ